MKQEQVAADSRSRSATLSVRCVLRACAVWAIVVAASSGALETAAASGGKEDGAPKGAPEDAEITADTMEVDFAARVAKFEGDVLVTDSRMSLRTDRLMAYFTEDHKLLKVEAMGNVVIFQPDADRSATAGYAEYDVKTSAVSLTETPELRTGQNSLTGADKIIYFRDSQTSRTVGGRPKFRVVPKGHDDALKRLFRTQEKRREDAVKMKYEKTGAEEEGRKDGR